MVVLPPRRPRPYTLDHLLAVNDVLIAAKLLAREDPDTVKLRGLYHDRDLRAWQPALPVVPDGFADLVVQTSAGWESFPILLELDMGTTDRRRWQEKVRRYVPLLTHGLEAAFGTTVATVAVVVQDIDKRVTDLKHWTEQELARAAAGERAHLFYFTQLPLELAAPDFFFSPRFFVGGRAKKEALLPSNTYVVSTPPAGR
jgi:hypothetical protein